MTPILESVKTALVDGESTVNLREASTLTGSGSDVGGRVIYDDAFAALRYANPLRTMARVITSNGSDQAFVVKTGNATALQSGTDNPWDYTIKNNVGNEATSFWQISMKCINAVVPVRTAVLDDINNLEETLVSDIALEFAQQEALSMMLNNDSGTGTATPQTGNGYGLRGLNFYAGSTVAASFGTSGSATTNGRHTMLQVTQTYPTYITYDEMVALASALPAQYWNNPSTAWMMHPSTILVLRDIKDSTGMPLFLELGQKTGSAVGNIFGHPVIANPYMDEIGSGKYPIYLAAWDRFLTIADNEEIKFQRLEQTQPGFVNLYAEKRLCSTILDVFAGVRLYRSA